MEIKVCGITNLNDAFLVQETGIWAMGFIFVENTPRYITPEKAGEIISQLSSKTEKAGVFVNPNINDIVNTCKAAGITKIQLHGEEAPEFCREISLQTGKKIIKTVRIKKEADIGYIGEYKGSVRYILLDTYSEKAYGGTGEIFDWEIARKAVNYGIPIIMAGGITPDNIQEAYETVHPFAVDICSGVEKEKGFKDAEKLDRLRQWIQKN